MNIDLNTVLADDTNIAGELIGLDGLNGELYGQLEALDAVSRARAMKKLAKRPHPSRGSRAELEKFAGQLPTHVKQQLFNKQLRLADYMIYSIKPANGRTIKMFEPQDDKATGLRNVANGKLEKNQVLMVSGVMLLAGIAGGSADDDAMVATYGSISAIPAIANGEFGLKANKVQIIPEGTANSVFVTDNHNGIQLGFWKLDNPRLINDEESIELTIELGSTTGIPANTFVKVGLWGTATTP